MNVLMVGVDKGRAGGMWSVAETYINDDIFNTDVNLTYVSTSTGGSAIKRIFKMLKGYIEIIIVLLTKKIDIVHVHMAEKGSVYRKGYVISLARAFNVKVITHMHAGPIMSWYKTLSERKKKRVSNILNSCDKVLVLGEYWKREMTVIVPENKLLVLYNGAECPPANNYNLNGRYITFLGMITKIKGAFDLIDAIDLIHDKLPPDIRIIICGYDGNNEAKQYIEHKRLQNKIFLPGWIDPVKREKYFMDTRLCVLPSYFEGLSMTVIEAMAHGIPVITTNISTMPELVGNEVELFRPGDVKKLADIILEMSTNEELRSKQSQLLYERACKQFSIEANINKTISIYQSCIAE